MLEPETAQMVEMSRLALAPARLFGGAFGRLEPFLA